MKIYCSFDKEVDTVSDFYELLRTIPNGTSLWVDLLPAYPIAVSAEKERSGFMVHVQSHPFKRMGINEYFDFINQSNNDHTEKNIKQALELIKKKGSALTYIDPETKAVMIK